MDCHAFLDAMHVLFPPYRGPAVRLFRGADAPEARRRKFFGISWTSDIEAAHWFAKRYADCSVGGVVFETTASSRKGIALISPHLCRQIHRYASKAGYKRCSLVQTWRLGD
jgi:hypothetical protein